ncbi:MAG: peptidase prolyl oligopeptidase active site protein [Ferruginibacter sp.]|nr:peptidase prolyl oligopeptidase active site protein [Ferruginibacter sp.]
MKFLFQIFFFNFLWTGVSAQKAVKRTLQPGDVYLLKTIGETQVSPDGKWIAYTLSNADSVRDKRNSDIWMTSLDGEQNVQLTSSEESEHMPRWSPDGKYISFLATRNGDKVEQIWLLDRRGGEAKKITAIKGDLDEYTWSPDEKKIAMCIKDEDFSDTAKSKTKAPYVMDRYHFKQDRDGWIGNRHTHLYVFDIRTKKTDTLTRGNFDEGSPAWSPDGKQLAFVSNRSADPDKNENEDIWIMNASAGAPLKQLTQWPGRDRNPWWSPDGKWIAYTSSSSNLLFTMYGQNTLSLVPSDGGKVRSLAPALDRPVSNIRWAKDGRHLSFLVDDDRRKYIASLNLQNNTIETVAGGERSFSGIEPVPGSDVLIATISEPQLPAEIYVVENNRTRRLTHVQDSFVNAIQFATVEGFTSTSKDGTRISNILYRPYGAVAGQKLPLILFIHGGPVGQDDYGFDFSRQMLAAGGYAVAGVNYRGSSGRGIDFTKSIYADWGNKEVLDILGAADYLVSKGIADDRRMGIGGWSYGGILTNYTIATDSRFKAAASGAGSALQFSMYGVDQYITQYETELGAPWKNPKKWMDLSYPFFKADKIKTPTLFMAGEKDFNVPSAGAEQMYQALRSLGIPTQLIIYPGQFHGITKPSYQVDRFERYLKWFGKYLQPEENK